MYINQIFVYPFKSAKGVELEECKIDDHGVQYDRLYMLAKCDSHGNWTALTQLQEPLLSLIETSISGTDLNLKYKDSSVNLPLNTAVFDDVDAPMVEIELGGSVMHCKQISGVVEHLAKFFTDFLLDCRSNSAKDAVSEIIDGISPRVGVVVSSKRRTVNQTVIPTKVTSSFQYLWPVSLMTTASFEDLERHIQADDETSRINSNCFRMNFVVKTEEPWIEDDWRAFTIGGNEFRFVCHCDRCSMVTVDQALGELSHKRQPLRSMDKFRVIRKGFAPMFGINVVQTSSGYSIRKGDLVLVTEQDSS